MSSTYQKMRTEDTRLEMIVCLRWAARWYVENPTTFNFTILRIALHQFERMERECRDVKDIKDSPKAAARKRRSGRAAKALLKARYGTSGISLRGSLRGPK